MYCCPLAESGQKWGPDVDSCWQRVVQQGVAGTTAIDKNFAHDVATGSRVDKNALSRPGRRQQGHLPSRQELGQPKVQLVSLGTTSGTQSATNWLVPFHQGTDQMRIDLGCGGRQPVEHRWAHRPSPRTKIQHKLRQSAQHASRGLEGLQSRVARP